MKQTSTRIKKPSFNQRVVLVSAEVGKLVSGKSQSQREALQARLWCQWLRSEVLSYG